jgi:hypothetical protein
MLTVPIGMLMNAMLKYAFHRSRPAWDDPILLIGSFSFPSGHAMTATLLYGFLAAFVVRKVQAWRWQVLAVLAGGLLIGLISLSRLYLGVHYWTDVLAGMAAGVAWLALCLTAVGALRRHRVQRRGAGTTEIVFPAPRPRALFHNQVVFHRFAAPNAAGDLSCLLFGRSRIDKAAQLDFPFERLNIDLEHFQGGITQYCGFYLGRDRRVIDVLAGALFFWRGRAPHEYRDQPDADQDT